MTVDELFERHGVIALDSNVLIHLLQDSGSSADAAQAVLDGVEAGRADAAIASIALTEVLSAPAATGDQQLFERLDGDLWSIQGLTVVPLDRQVAMEAARARGEGHGLADAIHLATARTAGATCFVTNDQRIRGRSGVEVILLSSITVPTDESVPSDA